MAYPWPVLGTLGERREHTLDETTAHLGAPHKEKHSRKSTYEHVFARKEETRDPEGNLGGHVENNRNSAHAL